MLLSSVGDAAPAPQTVALALGACDPLADYSDVSELFGLLVFGCVAIFVMRQFIYKQIAGNQ